MTPFTYNEMTFTLEPRDGAWDLRYTLAGGASALAGTRLFPGLAEAAAEAKALTLARTIFPVGIRSVGPDVQHPNTIGDLKIVGPDVTHPNFIYWNKDSSSCAKEL
jgi:hypothetical protein